MQNVIALEGVGKRYGDGPQVVWALSDVSLTVRSGEFVALMGPSGSGKSTLLNLVAGLDLPTKGNVKLLEQRLDALSEDARSDLRLRSVGFVFQTFNLFPNLTAQDNVAWPHRFLGASWREARVRAAALLLETGIDSMAQGRMPCDLSGGEQQRVAIARALINDPAVLLADEPTGNLDGRTAHGIIERLASLSAARGLSVLLVTHNPTVAAYAHRIVQLEEGHLVDESQSPARGARRMEGRA